MKDSSTKLRMTMVALIALTLTACEKMDFSEAGGTENTIITQPTETGEGTVEAPLTITQFLNGDSVPDTCWVIGYAVGSTYKAMKNAVFAAEGNYAANVLLADSRDCRDGSLCLPVELKSAAMQEAFSLAYHPEYYQQCIVIRGISGKYFSQAGVRNASAGRWFPELDLNEINPLPENWEEESFEY